jgi:hypothetical protein
MHRHCRQWTTRLRTTQTDSQPNAEIPAVKFPNTPAGIDDIPEKHPQPAQPEIQANSPPKGPSLEKFIKPVGIAAASLVAAATLGGLIWAFKKWKNRGTKTKDGVSRINFAPGSIDIKGFHTRVLYLGFIVISVC